MEITAPDSTALTSLVGRHVVVTFVGGSVIGAGGLTKLTAVNAEAGRVTLTTRGGARAASISRIEKVGVVTLLPKPKGRVLDVDLKAGA